MTTRYTLAVRFVADVGHALDPLVARRFGDLFDQARLADLERNRRQYNRLTVVPAFLDDVRCAHHHRTTPGGIGIARAALTQHQRAGREIRTGNDRHQFVEGDFGIVDRRQRRVDHFAQIVRRDVGRHADRDAAGAVDEQIGVAGREDGGFGFRPVIVRLKIDGVLVEIAEQHVRDLGEARFGVTHRRRRIGIHRPKIALTVDERDAHRPVLRHARERVVDRAVAVRVIFTHHVADDTRRFAVGAARDIAAFKRRIEDAAVDRFQAVAHVGQRAADDDAHRIIEVGRLHFVDDVDRRNAVFRRRRRRIFFGQDPAFFLLFGRWVLPSRWSGERPAIRSVFRE